MLSAGLDFLLEIHTSIFFNAAKATQLPNDNKIIENIKSKCVVIISLYYTRLTFLHKMVCGEIMQFLIFFKQ
jgi:hypothetical protein